MKISEITALVITFNEEENIRRTLSSLRILNRVIVLDSGSTDCTKKIVSEFDFCELHHREFDTFAAQCNYGLGLVETPWVLSLDADYFVPGQFFDEIRNLSEKVNITGFSANFTYCIRGKPVAGTSYPPRTVLYQPTKAKYENRGHGHVLEISGNIKRLKSRILHDDRKPLSRWLESQNKYATQEARYLTSASEMEYGIADKFRKRIFLMPFIITIYILFWKKNIFYGRAGIEYWLQRLYAECLISLKVMDQKNK